MKLAIVGATGMVGQVMIKVIEEQNFPYDEVLLVASEKSAGKTLLIKGEEKTVITLEQALEEKPNIAIFSAGGSTSLEWAPKFAKIDCTVIDNSSAWRMVNDIPLVVPEINANEIMPCDRIIANPNCSTIQMVLALSGLHRRYHIKRLVVSTYQSVTGTGVKAQKQMEDERAGKETNRVYPHPIDLNVLPHGGDFDEDGYTSEEIKLENETQKILGDKDIQVTATVVRVPVLGGHSEAINVEFWEDFDLSEVKKIIENTEGVIVQDNPANFEYPMPLNAEGKDEVFVGRIRRDFSQENSLNLWVVADNLRKGAATNAVQIAKHLFKIRDID